MSDTLVKSLSNEIRVSGIENDSIVDGPGLRLAIFFQGCPIGCEGCHNPESQPMDGGTLMTEDELFSRIEANPLITGVTFTGGEPIVRAEALASLAERIREKGLDLAIFSGYTFEQIIEGGDTEVLRLLSYAHTLIDGPFILAERSLALPFRGSTNQRILDLEASMKEGRAVPTKDPSWLYEE
ncbi:MAG: radical SAM protein [Clostridiales Family XIII bacterium]|jgi:anaerobic ribonucleoside-triphosphate reductase activating protein|nr:radical SAM protein [Clostridiales Family XIII bacterium]